jgi:hypothetical protein
MFMLKHYAVSVTVYFLGDYLLPRYIIADAAKLVKLFFESLPIVANPSYITVTDASCSTGREIYL